MIKKLKEGIINLIIWFPIIWKDRDWDHQFLYEIIRFKLKRMAKFHRKYGISVDADKYAKQMELCVNLLNRIINDEYLSMVLKKHEEKWGESKMVFTPCEDDERLLKLDFEVEKAKTEVEKEQETKEKLKLYEHADYLKQQDLDMLFRTIRKYIEGWWD